jgi:hypothetical protein
MEENDDVNQAGSQKLESGLGAIDHTIPIGDVTNVAQPANTRMETAESSQQDDDKNIAVHDPVTAIAEFSPKPKAQPSVGHAAAQIDTEYKLKQIHFNNRVLNIITQNRNGPCPLLAICNSSLTIRQCSPS